MMSTTYENAMEQHKADLEERTLHRRIEGFFHKWSPEDKEKSDEFHTDLHLLVRSMYQDAMIPLQKTVTDIISAIPYIPTVVDRNKL